MAETKGTSSGVQFLMDIASTGTKPRPSSAAASASASAAATAASASAAAPQADKKQSKERKVTIDSTPRDATVKEVRTNEHLKGLFEKVNKEPAMKLVYEIGHYADVYAATVHVKPTIATMYKGTNVALFPTDDETSVPRVVELTTAKNVRDFNLAACSFNDYVRAIWVATRMLDFQKERKDNNATLFYADHYLQGIMRGMSSAAMARSVLHQDNALFKSATVVLSDEQESDLFLAYLKGPMCKSLIPGVACMTAEAFSEKYTAQNQENSAKGLVLCAGLGIPDSVFDSDVFPRVSAAFGFVPARKLFYPGNDTMKPILESYGKARGPYTASNLEDDYHTAKNKCLAPCLLPAFYDSNPEETVNKMVTARKLFGATVTDAHKKYIQDQKAKTGNAFFGEFNDFLVMVKLVQSFNLPQQAIVAAKGADGTLGVAVQTGTEHPEFAVWTVQRRPDDTKQTRVELAVQEAIRLWREEVNRWKNDPAKKWSPDGKVVVYGHDAIDFFSKFHVAVIDHHKNMQAVKKVPKDGAGVEFGFCFRPLIDDMEVFLQQVDPEATHNPNGELTKIREEVRNLPVWKAPPRDATIKIKERDGADQQPRGGGGRFRGRWKQRRGKK